MSTLEAHNPDSGEFTSISLQAALDLIDEVKKAIVLDSDSDFDWKAFSGLLTYYCKENNSDEINLVVETNRDLGRAASEDKSAPSLLGASLRSVFKNSTRAMPTLVMLEQKGTKAKGWTGDTGFWWPILSTPTNAKPCVFANLGSK